MARTSTRTNAVGGLAKRATRLAARSGGGEKVVLQGVRDMVNELGALRRNNERLQRENATLRERIDRLRESGRGRGRPTAAAPGTRRVAASSKRATARKPASTGGSARKRRNARQGGVEATIRSLGRRIGG